MFESLPQWARTLPLWRWNAGLTLHTPTCARQVKTCAFTAPEMDVCKVIYMENWKSTPFAPRGKTASLKAPEVMFDFLIYFFLNAYCLDFLKKKKKLLEKTGYIIMGLAFVSDTKHRNESFPLIFHARWVSAGLSPTGGLLTERSRVEEKRKTWLALNTRYLNPA